MYSVTDLDLLIKEYEASLAPMKEKLLQIQFNNKQHEKYKRIVDEANQYLLELEEYNAKLLRCLTINEKEQELYEKKNIQFVQELANSIMALIRPLENYRLQLVTKSIGKNKYLYTYVIPLNSPNPKPVPPEVEMGKFMKQLTSLTICLAVSFLLGQTEILLDEPLASASGTSLLTIQPVFKEFKGVTFYIVDQKPEMYSNLPRKEIYVKKVFDTADPQGHTIVEKEVIISEDTTDKGDIT